MANMASRKYAAKTSIIKSGEILEGKFFTIVPSSSKWTKLLSNNLYYSCSKITKTWIQISRQNGNGYFSNFSRQMMI